MRFESVDRQTAEGLARWQAAGSPPVPAVEIDGVRTPIMHVSQLARLLDLPAPPAPEVARVAFDLLLVVGAWAAIVRQLPWDVIVASTPSRGRTIRNLTMNAIHPVSLLEAAHESGRLDWGLADRDEQLAAAYEDTESLAVFVQDVHDGWSAALLANGGEPPAPDRWIETPRGRMLYSDLLAHQRWHVAFHHRQIVEFLDRRGIALAPTLRLDGRIDVALPPSVF